MKTPSLPVPFRRSAFALLLVCPALALAASPKAKTPDKNKADQAAGATAVSEFTPAEIPQSVFVIPATPREGRNPFFPQSLSRPVVTDTHKRVAGPTRLVLNGITSPPKRTAMINGRTFEVGESGEVKVGNGSKVLIHCEEIRDDSAVILLNGERRELRLRGGI